MYGYSEAIFLKIVKNVLKINRRPYVTKRKYPIDPSLADSLPVIEYPKREDGATSVHVWGTGEHGATGFYLQKKKKMRGRADGRFRVFDRPLRLTFAEYQNVINVATGFGFTIFVVRGNDKDKIFGTGLNTDSQIGVHEPRRNAPLGLILSPVPINLPQTIAKFRVVDVGAGRAHTAVVTDEGSVYTFGNNAYGQCGRRIIKDEKYSGNNIAHLISHLDGERVKNVECGQDHTLFLTETGKVYSCGWGADGQTGLGHFDPCGKPCKVIGDIEGENIVQLSSKGDCVLAINDKGDVFGWGNSEYSQLFTQDDSIQQINRAIALKKCRGFGKIISIAAGGSHCLMLNDNGEVFAWGYGILGQGPVVQQSWIPRLLPPTLFGQNEFRPDSRVQSISVGLSTSAAITNYGDLYTWGKNRGSILGLGNKLDQFFPLRVSIALKAVKISLGVDHAVCITKT